MHKAINHNMPRHEGVRLILKPTPEGPKPILIIRGERRKSRPTKTTPVRSKATPIKLEGQTTVLAKAVPELEDNALTRRKFKLETNLHAVRAKKLALETQFEQTYHKLPELAQFEGGKIAKDPGLKQWKAADKEETDLLEKLEALSNMKTFFALVGKEAAYKQKQTEDLESHLAVDEDSRELAEERYGKATAKSPEMLEAEYMTDEAQVLQLRQAIQGAEQTFEIETAKQQRLENTAAILGRERARQMWDEVDQYIQALPQRKHDSLPFNATTYTLTAAEYVLALRQKDITLTHALRRELDQMNVAIAVPYDPIIGTGRTKSFMPSDRARAEIAEVTGRIAGMPKTQGDRASTHIKKARNAPDLSPRAERSSAGPLKTVPMVIENFRQHALEVRDRQTEERQQLLKNPTKNQAELEHNAKETHLTDKLLDLTQYDVDTARGGPLNVDEKVCELRQEVKQLETEIRQAYNMTPEQLDQLEFKGGFLKARATDWWRKITGRRPSLSLWRNKNEELHAFEELLSGYQTRTRASAGAKSAASLPSHKLLELQEQQREATEQMNVEGVSPEELATEYGLGPEYDANVVETHKTAQLRRIEKQIGTELMLAALKFFKNTARREMRSNEQAVDTFVNALAKYLEARRNSPLTLTLQANLIEVGKSYGIPTKETLGFAMRSANTFTDLQQAA